MIQCTDWYEWWRNPVLPTAIITATTYNNNVSQYYSLPVLWGSRSGHRSPDPPEPETRNSPPGLVLCHHAPQWTWRRGQRSANQSGVYTHTHTHRGGCWRTGHAGDCEETCSDNIHIHQVYVSEWWGRVKGHQVRFLLVIQDRRLCGG